MKYIIAAFFLLASTQSLADKPDALPGNNGNNGNHYAYGKDQNNGNQSGINQRVAPVPESSTLALVALRLAGLIIARSRKK